MKTIERQIRNHQFEIQLSVPADQDPKDWVADERYFVDGQLVNRSDFLAAVALLSAEAPK